MTDELAQEGELVKVSMEVRIPTAATVEDVNEWLQFNFGAGSCKNGNPLSVYCVEPFGPSFDCEWMGQIGRVERNLKEERADGSKIYSVRYCRERIP